jgi:Zn-dependent peptidase ImmA (M78 family)
VREIRRRQIRALAERLLEEHGALRRPVPIEDVASALGIVIRRSATDEEVSGFLYRDKTGTTVIGVNARQHPNRQRFTTAHELGHFLLHVRSGVHVDSTSNGPLVLLRSEVSSEGTDPEEVEANAFASEVLMPASLFEQDLQKYAPLDLMEDEALDEAFSQLASLYQVSKQAVAFRVSRLGYAHL